MLDLIHYLTALQIYCKDAHYAFYGIDFKPLHEWADEISEPLDGFIDDLKEQWFIGNDLVVPRGVDINASAADYVPTALGENSQILANLQAIMVMAHNKLNGLDIKNAGINDTLGKIDAHLVKHIALINMAITHQKRDE